MIGYVYAWDGHQAIGPALYTSPVEALPGTGGFYLIAFDAGGLSLAQGQQYILVASTLGVPASTGLSTMKYIDGPSWIGGESYFQLTRYMPAWMPTDFDTAFRAEFSGNHISFVPEPSSLSLAFTAAGLVGLVVRLRSR
jgi:hypothetical protein